MGLLFSTRCTSTNRLDGKIAVITGANSGIGKETAKDFYQRGATVILACRNLKKANEAIEDIKMESADKSNLGELKVVELDLSSLESVRKCANYLLHTEDRINLLINNAGVMMCPYFKTKDGFELQFASNYLGHFLFTLLLLPKICKSAPARIVNVSSIVHWENNISGVNVYCLHPGIIRTELSRHYNSVFPGLTWIYNNLYRVFLKTPKQGAQTQIYCAVSDECANETGLYYSECKATCCSASARDMESAEKLWNISINSVGLEPTTVANSILD